MDNLDVTLSVFTSNIKSIVAIYNDSAEIRLRKTQEFEDKLNLENWTEEEFEEYSHYKFHFDWLLMQSLFLSGFSYFEVFMKSIAVTIEKIKGDSIKINAIRGDGILDTYRKYINLIGEIKAANRSNNNWRDLNEFKQIRNSITHNYGRINKNLNKVNEHNIYFGPSKKNIRIKNIGFLEDFVNTSINYMNSIVKEVKEKYDSQ